MQLEAAQLFRDVFGVKVGVRPGVEWLPSVDHFVTYDEKFHQFFFALDQLNQEKQDSFVESLNVRIQYSLSDYDTTYVHVIKNTATQQTHAVVHENTLRTLRDTIERRTVGANQAVIRHYYDRSIDAELLGLAKKAFNIDVIGTEEAREKRGPSQMIFDIIIDKHDDGRETTDYALFFSRGEGFNINGYGLLAQDLEQTIQGALRFLQGSLFPAEDQRQSLSSLFKGDAQAPLVLRMPRNPEKPNSKNYLLALHMGQAKQMVDAGLSFNLEEIVERRMQAYGLISLRHQEQSSVKAFHNRFNLDSLMNNPDGYDTIEHRGERIVSFRSGAISLESGKSTGHYETERGMPIDEAGKPLDLTRITFGLCASFLCLTQKELQSLQDELNTALLAVIGPQEPDNIFSLYEGHREPTLKIDYAPIDYLLRNQLAVDALPIFKKYNELQRTRINSAIAILDGLEEATGYGGWAAHGFPENFFLSHPEEIKLSLRLKNEYRTSEEDFPQPTSQYTEQATQIASILSANGLRKRVKVGAHAVRYAGGMTGHSLTIDMSVKSLEDAAALIAKIMPLKDSLAPLIEAAIEKSAPRSCFDEHLFGYPERGSAQYRHMEHIAFARTVAEIESIRQGLPTDEMDDSPLREARETVGSYIRYLAAAKQSTNPEISSLAANQLSTLASLSAATESMVVKAEAELTAPIPAIPAQSSGQPLPYLPK